MNPFDALFQTNDQDGGMGAVPPMLAQLLMNGGAGSPETQPASTTGLPPRSPVDNSMVLPMMLLAAAQQQSRTRPRGESRTHQNVMSVQDFFTTGMDVKAKNAEEERRTRKSQLEDSEAERRNAITDETLAGQRQSRAQDSAMFPLKKAAAESGLSKADIELRLKTKELAIADDINAAKLEREKAATDELRSRIDERIAKAEAGLQKIDLLRQELGIKAERVTLAGERQAAELDAKGRALEARSQRYHPGKPEEGVSARTIKVDGDKEYHYEFGLPPDVAMEKAKDEARTRKRVSGQDVPPEVVMKRAEELAKPKAFVIDYSDKFPRRIEMPNATAPQGQTPTPTKPTAPTAGKQTDSTELSPEDKTRILLAAKTNPGKGFRLGAKTYTVRNGQVVEFVEPSTEKPRVE